jgi:hypothetical protein
MRFDWYAATVPGGVDEVVGAMLAEWDLAGVEDSRPKHGYERGLKVTRGDRVLAKCWWGGVNGEDVHAWASGSEAPALAELLRREWPEHRVSRADVCEDYTAPDAWEQLSGVAVEVANKHRLKLDTRGDWARNLPGRTLGVGSRDSVAHVRVYEKGVQMAARGHTSADPNWVRVELEVKPQKRDGKLLAAATAPSGLWGAAKWTAGLVERLGAPEVEIIKLGTVYQFPDINRSRAALLKQYGPTLTAWAEELGGWESLGLKLGEELA